MKKRQKGSITVEATLFLPLFFLAFVSIYSLISFTRAQLIVQYAADQAAKEVAQYSYILEKIGILDSLDGLNSRSEDFEKNIKSIEEQLQTVQQAGENALNGEDPVGNTVMWMIQNRLFPGYWQCSKKMQSMAFLHTWLIRWQNPVS